MPSALDLQPDLTQKSIDAQISVDEAQGIVECFAAGIGNKDSVGDILVPGAFTASLGRRLPRVVWGHDWNHPIGKVLEIYEVGPGDPRLPAKMRKAGIGGLFCRVQFNLKSDRGREAFSNVVFFGADQEWSIGYKTLQSHYDNSRQANILKEVELYEVSPVLHGANQLTATISIKSDDPANPASGHAAMVARALAERVGGTVTVKAVEGKVVVFDQVGDDGSTVTMAAPFHVEDGEALVGSPRPHEVKEAKPGCSCGGTCGKTCGVDCPGATGDAPCGCGKAASDADVEVKAPEVAGIPQEMITGDVLRGHGPRRGNLEKLLRYWRPIMRKPGGFRRCTVILADHPELQPVQRICAWLHHETTGLWPNEGCHHPGMKNCRSKLRGVVRGSIWSDEQFNARLRRGKDADVEIEEKADVADAELEEALRALSEFADAEGEFLQMVNQIDLVHYGEDEHGNEVEHVAIDPPPCGCETGREGENEEAADGDAQATEGEKSLVASQIADLEVKIGRVISRSNRAKLQAALDALREVLAADVADETTPGPVEVKVIETLPEEVFFVKAAIDPIAAEHDLDVVVDRSTGGSVVVVGVNPEIDAKINEALAVSIEAKSIISRATGIGPRGGGIGHSLGLVQSLRRGLVVVDREGYVRCGVGTPNGGKFTNDMGVGCMDGNGLLDEANAIRLDRNQRAEIVRRVARQRARPGRAPGAARELVDIWEGRRTPGGDVTPEGGGSWRIDRRTLARRLRENAPEGNLVVREPKSESGQSLIFSPRHGADMERLVRDISDIADENGLGIEVTMGEKPVVRVRMPDDGNLNRNIRSLAERVNEWFDGEDRPTGDNQTPIPGGIVFEDLPDADGRTWMDRNRSQRDGAHGVGVVEQEQVHSKEWFEANPWEFRPKGVPGLKPDTLLSHHNRVFEEVQEGYKPVKELDVLAKSLRGDLGLPDPKIENWTEVEAPFRRLMAIATAFDGLSSDPTAINEECRLAYRLLVEETKRQWNALQEAGYKIEFLDQEDMMERAAKGLPGGDPKGANPYAFAADQAADLRDNKHLFVATTADWVDKGLRGADGTYDDSQRMPPHPMLDTSKGGEYDMFRAVHDAFGHAAVGTDFTRHGEYQAWLHHMSMMPPLARRAASVELTGENSYLAWFKKPAPHRAQLLPANALRWPFDDEGNYVPTAWRGDAPPLHTPASQLRRRSKAANSDDEGAGEDENLEIRKPQKYGDGQDEWAGRWGVRNPRYAWAAAARANDLPPRREVVAMTEKTLLRVDTEDVFALKEHLDPVLSFHEIDHEVTEDGLVVKSLPTDDAAYALNNALSSAEIDSLRLPLGGLFRSEE